MGDKAIVKIIVAVDLLLHRPKFSGHEDMKVSDMTASPSPNHVITMTCRD